MVGVMEWIVNRFAYIVLSASMISLVYPPAFTWFSGRLITGGLGLIMLGMGLTLKREDFQRVLTQPAKVFLGVGLQFTVMPALGFSIGYLFALPPEYLAGLILVASCPGGTASNVIAFIAKADVALSVSMTALSTLLAVFLTPILTTLLVGSQVEVSAIGLFKSAIQVVLLPVVSGVIMREYFSKQIRQILPLAPAVAVVIITMIVASIIGAGKEKIISSGWSIIASVLTLHLIGFGAGYFLSRLIQPSSRSLARTVSIEVGMQNSGLGVVLARENFAHPATAIPSAISSLVHSLIGSILAARWRKTSGV